MNNQTDWKLAMAACLCFASLIPTKAVAEDIDDETKQIEQMYRKKVVKLAGELGHAKFKVRKRATKELIRIGKGAGKDGHKNAVARTIVEEIMKSRKKSDDPEIAARASTVLLALIPAPAPPAKGGRRVNIRNRGLF